MTTILVAIFSSQPWIILNGNVLTNEAQKVFTITKRIHSLNFPDFYQKQIHMNAIKTNSLFRRNYANCSKVLSIDFDVKSIKMILLVQNDKICLIIKTNVETIRSIEDFVVSKYMSFVDHRLEIRLFFLPLLF